jgi:uncharacterized FlgJ-related protein
MNSINEIYKDIYSWLIENGFSYRIAQYITAQSAFETGNFTSNIYLNNHKLFGMKLARVRNTTAIGEKFNHAVYENIIDSLKDFKIYFESFKYLQNYSSLTSYIQAIKKNSYFEADEESYFKGVNHYLKLYFNDTTA